MSRDFTPAAAADFTLAPAADGSQLCYKFGGAAFKRFEEKDLKIRTLSALPAVELPAGSAELLHLASEMVEYRGLHDAYAGRYEDRHSRGATPAQVACDRVVALLRQLNVSRIAVGHTPEESVRVRCGGRLLALEADFSQRPALDSGERAPATWLSR